MISDAELEAAHNGLADTDEEFGRTSAYVKMSTFMAKKIKSEAFLKASGTVAEREAVAYASLEFSDYLEKLKDATYTMLILEAKRESWQREIDIWRTLSANRRR